MEKKEFKIKQCKNNNFENKKLNDDNLKIPGESWVYCENKLSKHNEKPT